MAKENDHVSVLREAYRRWHDTKGGSVQYWLDLMTDDISFRSLSGGRVEGSSAMGFNHDNTQREAVAAYFAAMANEWEMVRFGIVDMFDTATAVAVHGRPPA